MRANQAMVTAAMVVAGALTSGRAMAAEALPTATVTTRRVVVSIPDRKLAVIENNEVVQVFAVAVGA